MGFIADIFGGGAARHAANVANVRDQAIAQQQRAAGQTAYNNLMNAIPTANAPLQSYIATGNAAAAQYQADLPYLTSQYAPTQAQLNATPGYQFTLQQGLQSTQNAQAAQGLGVSGSALKAAAAYATGLAQNTYAQDAGIYQQGQQIAGQNLLNGLNTGLSAGQAASGNIANLTDAANQAYLGQYNQGAATSIAGNQTAANGQLAYNSALSTPINAIAQLGGAYLGYKFGGGSSAPPSTAAPAAAPNNASNFIALNQNRQPSNPLTAYFNQGGV